MRPEDVKSKFRSANLNKEARAALLDKWRTRMQQSKEASALAAEKDDDVEWNRQAAIANFYERVLDGLE